MTQFGGTTENLRFCEVWTNDGYGLIRNATREDSEDETLTSWDRFRVTEVLGEVPDTSRYFWVLRFGLLALEATVLYNIIFQNELHGCVCFSKTFNNN